VLQLLWRQLLLLQLLLAFPGQQQIQGTASCKTPARYAAYTSTPPYPRAQYHCKPPGLRSLLLVMLLLLPAPQAAAQLGLTLLLLLLLVVLVLLLLQTATALTE
jgi:hypothetical protein